jgi:peptide/nickel transport system permease protein
MTQYIIRRFLLMIPVLLGVSILVFVLARILPGDVFTAQAAGSGIDQATRDHLRKEAGLDRSLVVQYLDWLDGVVVGDFGESLYNNRSVSEAIKRAIPVTFELTLLALLISLVIAIPAGVISAATRGSPIDYVARFSAVLGLSVPSYVLGTLVISYLAIWFKWVPPPGYYPLFKEPWQNIQQFTIPALILGASSAAAIMRMTRSTVLGVLREDYVRTARAKGLQQQLVLVRHVLRNALLPVLTLVGTQAGFLLGGSVIIEAIFTLNGLGSLSFDAVNNRDYIVLQGVTLLAAAVFSVLNLLVDLSYAWLDPRIRLS